MSQFRLFFNLANSNHALAKKGDRCYV